MGHESDSRLECDEGATRGKVEAAYMDCSFKTLDRGPREMDGCLKEMLVQDRGIFWSCFGLFVWVFKMGEAYLYTCV